MLQLFGQHVVHDMECLLSRQVHVDLNGVVELAQSPGTRLVIADDSPVFEFVESSTQIERNGWWSQRFKGKGKPQENAEKSFINRFRQVFFLATRCLESSNAQAFFIVVSVF